MKKKWLIIIGVLLLLVVMGGLIAYKEFMRKPKGAMETEAVYELSPAEISKSFMEDEQTANKAYVGKAIAITGVISEVKTDDKGNHTLVFSDSAMNVTISAALDSIYNEKGAALKSGDKVCVKGFCIGFNKDELLGSDVLFNRCGITDSQ